MDEVELKQFLARNDLRIIAGLAADLGVDAFLVGGALRDLLLGREANDLDFALSGAWTELPRIFADRISGSFFWLDEERQQSRVVKKRDDLTAVYDFTPLCGGAILEDLARRDFTINALAIPLFGDRRDLVDPFHGCDDLQQGSIRMCVPAAFDSDPLRLLRAVRFSAELGFAIEEVTWETIRRKVPLLGRVAAERVRDELFRILAAPGCGASLRRLCATGLWQEIAAPMKTAPGEAGIARVEAAERLCLEAGRLIPEGKEALLGGYLDRDAEAGISIRSLIKLAAFLGCGEQGGMAPLAERLRLGKEAGKILDLFCRDEREVFGILERNRAERVIYRFFRDREPAGPGMLIIARAAGDVSEKSYLSLVGYWLREYNAEAAELFLTGGEIMAILGVPPGQVVGEAMARLRATEGSGHVNSREEAREFIKNLLTKEEPIG